MIDTQRLADKIGERVKELYNVEPHVWDRSVEFRVDSIDYVIIINYRVPLRYVDERKAY